MRVTWRARGNEDYWRERWGKLPADGAVDSPGTYPQKYTAMLLDMSTGPVLEAGCGNGRVLRNVAAQGRRVVGMDFIGSALGKLRRVDPTLELVEADIKFPPFAANSFGGVLAFGLFHNLEAGIDAALAETLRILKPCGIICLSFRADNPHNRVIDLWTDIRSGGLGHQKEKRFHKVNLSRSECVDLVRGAGFQIMDVQCVENMSFLYKFSLFRARTQKIFGESQGRAQGYRLSRAGAFIQGSLMRLCPEKACNVFVIFARKPEQ